MTDFIFKESKTTDSPFFLSHPEVFVRGRKAGAQAARDFMESQHSKVEMDTSHLESYAAELAGRSEGHADFVIWLMATLNEIYRQGTKIKSKKAA
jgi:hypothetical protein